MTLGCVSEYHALIQSKDGIGVGELPMSSVKFDRKLDSISEAEIEIPLAGPGCEPCGLVSSLRPWHHELYLFRDNEFVWSGPITKIQIRRDSATVYAGDLFQLMDFRLVHNDMCFAQACGGAATELVDIGAALIDDAFVLDGHNYEIVKFNQTGLLGERLYLPGEHSLDVLGEALRLGLDATVLGRRIILGAVPFGSTDALTDEDFVGDLEIEIDGLGMATRVITKGDGVVGLAVADGADANGVHPYYGLIESEGNDRGELGTQTLADQAAKAIVDSKFPPPVTLSTPTGARLAATAPVNMSDLVPGTLVPVISDQLCTPVSGEYILIEVTVEWDQDTNEEQVSITLGSVTSANSGESSVSGIG